MIGISACLGGISCRYDGQAKTIPQLSTIIDEGEALLICPEILGGLPVPREPAEIIGGDGLDVWNGLAKVVTVSGEDVTEAFKQGAIIACQKLKELGISCVLMKEFSPSCGSCMIYDGSFSGSRTSGKGVASAYFEQEGIKVIPEEEWAKAIEESRNND